MYNLLHFFLREWNLHPFFKKLLMLLRHLSGLHSCLACCAPGAVDVLCMCLGNIGNKALRHVEGDLWSGVWAALMFTISEAASLEAEDVVSPDYWWNSWGFLWILQTHLSCFLFALSSSISLMDFRRRWKSVFWSPRSIFFLCVKALKWGEELLYFLCCAPSVNLK